MSDDTISETVGTEAFDVPPFDEPEPPRSQRDVPPRPDGPDLAPVDQARIEAAVREILAAIGEDPDRDGLLDTPARVARMYAEICAGLHETPTTTSQVTFEADHDEMVMVRDIPLYSLCEHHLVPFIGKAHVAYIPNNDGRVTGLSKLARLVDGYARRPQVQERLTTQIADAIERTPAARRACWWSSRPSTCACRCAASASRAPPRSPRRCAACSATTWPPASRGDAVHPAHADDRHRAARGSRFDARCTLGCPCVRW